MSSELKLLEEQLETEMKVSLQGEVDIYTSQSLKDRLYQLVDANKMDLVIDCKDLNYIDSTGLGILVGALKKAKQYGKIIRITHLRENIKKLFIITGLDKVFIIEE